MRPAQIFNAVGYAYFIELIQRDDFYPLLLLACSDLLSRTFGHQTVSRLIKGNSTMKALKQYAVDAFTDKVFAGNPAAVCVLA